MKFNKGDLVRDILIPNTIGIIVEPDEHPDAVNVPNVLWLLHPIKGYSRARWPRCAAYLERIITDEVW